MGRFCERIRVNSFQSRRVAVEELIGYEPFRSSLVCIPAGHFPPRARGLGHEMEFASMVVCAVEIQLGMAERKCGGGIRAAPRGSLVITATGHVNIAPGSLQATERKASLVRNVLKGRTDNPLTCREMTSRLPPPKL